MRIAVADGGPGGLFFATLMRRADPSAEITVFERNRADDAFGFGVVFSDRTLAAIDEADPVLREALSVHGRHCDDIEVRLKGEQIRLDDPPDVIRGTQGRPLSPADEVRLVDELDQDVPADAPRSLLTRGPYTPRGYYRAAEQNARAFTADGWYRSGDICRRTPEGNLIVEGRDKDMINRGGENISTEEVENLVYRIPEVSEVAAVAMPDLVLGERVCLYIVPRPGSDLTLERIRQSMEDAGVARYKFPEHLVLTDSLPATKVGKIDKKALRADIARRCGLDATAIWE